MRHHVDPLQTFYTIHTYTRSIVIMTFYVRDQCTIHSFVLCFLLFFFAFLHLFLFLICFCFRDPFHAYPLPLDSHLHLHYTCIAYPTALPHSPVHTYVLNSGTLFSTLKVRGARVREFPRRSSCSFVESEVTLLFAPLAPAQRSSTHDRHVRNGPTPSQRVQLHSKKVFEEL